MFLKRPGWLCQAVISQKVYRLGLPTSWLPHLRKRTFMLHVCRCFRNQNSIERADAFETRFEQGKTVLAAIGLLALVSFFLGRFAGA